MVLQVTLGFLLFAAGLAFLASGISGNAVKDVLKGVTGGDLPFGKTPDYGPDPGGGDVTESPLHVASHEYADPFGRAKVQKGRIDQGVDFTGRGPILAVGDALITDVAAHGSGWADKPGGGAYVEYRLTGGPNKGKYIFVAEDIRPHVRKGQRVKAGQRIASFVAGAGRSIETGWAAGSGRHAAAHGHYVEGQATPEGNSFDDFLKAVGL